MAFLRVNTGVCDPALIGDKSKWYAHTLEPMTFKVWQEGSSLGTTLRAGTQIENPPTGKIFRGFLFIILLNFSSQTFFSYSLGELCFVGR